MRGDKIVVVEMRIAAINTVDFAALPGGEAFVRIETGDPLKESLPAQDFVDARDAAGKLVRRIKEGGIAIRDLHGAMEYLGWEGIQRPDGLALGQ